MPPLMFFWNYMYAWWVCNVTVSLAMSVFILADTQFHGWALELIHESELSWVKYHARIPAGLPGKCYNYILLPFHMDESWSVKASEICKTLNYFGLIFAQLSPIHSRINNSPFWPGPIIAEPCWRAALSITHWRPNVGCSWLFKILSGFTTAYGITRRSQIVFTPLAALQFCSLKKRFFFSRQLHYFNPL